MKQKSEVLKKSEAEVRVIAINTLYEKARKAYEYEKKHFAQFLGNEIFKVDGGIKQKYTHLKIEQNGHLPDGTAFEVSYHYDVNSGSFDLKFRICVRGGSMEQGTYYCQYQYLSLGLFEIQDGKLTEKISDLEWLNQRFDYQELKAVAAEIKQAKEDYEKVVDKMDRNFRDVFHIGRIVDR